jgi:hypothetical protein
MKNQHVVAQDVTIIHVVTLQRLQVEEKMVTVIVIE